MKTKNEQPSQSTGTSFSEIYTITSDDQMGHDNLGHNIPELLKVTTSPESINISSSLSTALSFHPQHFTSQEEIMSPLPVHNRPMLGRRLGFSIDALIWIFFIVWLFVIEAGYFPQQKRGFFCDDRSIALPFKGDTISTGMILSTVLFVYPVLWIAEACFFVPVSIKSSRFIESARRAWRWYKEFVFGFVLHLFFIDGIKVLFGELRPHFLYTCRPDALQTCTGSQYVADWTCTNTIDNPHFVGDASKSFPSGHSSISFFDATFLIWFFQARSPKLRSQFLIPTIQCVFLMFASFCAVSRVADHRHHWWDVLIGSTIGVIFAILVCNYLCKKFQLKKVPNIEPVLQNIDTLDHRHTSVRRLLSERTKDELNLNHVVVP